MRVRLLLDDNNTAGSIPILAALDAHPNIEVRLFNPFVSAPLRARSNYLTDFARVNRRMHNKSFTADNQATIVGGRNVGDEYFGAGERASRSPTSTCSPSGRWCARCRSDFDRYWNSASAYPAVGLLGRPAQDAAATLEAAGSRRRAPTPASSAYLEALAQRRRSCASCSTGKLAARVGDARSMVSDDPAKTLDTTRADDVLLLPELVRSGRRGARARPRLAVLRAGRRRAPSSRGAGQAAA